MNGRKLFRIYISSFLVGRKEAQLKKVAKVEAEVGETPGEILPEYLFLNVSGQTFGKTFFPSIPTTKKFFFLLVF
jgi:hypothetical protein